MTVVIEPWLEKLENLVDEDHVVKTRELQRKAFAFEPVDHIPTVIYYPHTPEEWPQFDFREIYADKNKMLLSELELVYKGAKLKDDRLYGIRPNYGTGIIASMFGCETVTFEDTLPISRHVGRQKIDAIIDAGVPDIHTGEMNNVLEAAAFFRESLAPYPKLSRLVGSQVFDIQGPFDNASIIWGSEIFIAVYDEPETVVKLLKVISDTIIAAIKAQRQADGCQLEEHDGAWNNLGGIVIRADSCINLGGSHFLDIEKPFDEYLLSHWGGWVHFCGKAHQWWEMLLDIPGLTGINPFQGEFYNLIDMFGKCEAAKVPIVQWTTPLDAPARERVRTGFSRVCYVSSYEEAQQKLDNLHTTGHADSE